MKLVLLAFMFIFGSVSFGQANNSLSNLTAPTAINQDLIFGVTSGDHYVKSDGSDNVVIQAGGGLNLYSGSSVIVKSGGFGPVLIQTGDQSGATSSSDVDIESGQTADGDSGGISLMTPTPSGSGSQGSIQMSSSYVAVSTTEGFQISNSGSRPTCNDSYAGTLWYAAGGSGVADELQVCMKAADGSYSWVTK